eukprot:1155834-Pelagomonas_calceolata.AAC.1
MFCWAGGLFCWAGGLFCWAGGCSAGLEGCPALLKAIPHCGSISNPWCAHDALIGDVLMINLSAGLEGTLLAAPPEAILHCACAALGVALVVRL